MARNQWPRLIATARFFCIAVGAFTLVTTAIMTLDGIIQHGFNGYFSRSATGFEFVLLGILLIMIPCLAVTATIDKLVQIEKRREYLRRWAQDRQRILREDQRDEAKRR